MNLKGKVTFAGELFVFEVRLHFSQNSKDLKMEIQEFYQKWAKVPQGDHYEMEILTLPPDAEGVKLHIHPVGQGKFICWTGQIPNLQSAQVVFKVWCLGCVYTIFQGEDFGNYLFGEKIHGDVDLFEARLREDYEMKFEL
jgi:hypothetical protein